MTPVLARTLFGLIALLGSGTHVLATEERAEAVCNAVLEPFAFWLWNRSAGTPHLQETDLPPGIGAIEYTARDGRVLRGYRIRPPSTPQGFVLVMQGNATLAERLLAHLGGYAKSGYAVYVYDYRGYANSEGRPRLKAIVEDYREIFTALGQREPGERLLYGMSFGGIVLLNVIGTGVPFDRAVIDSTPARIAGYGCPDRYDPVANLPADASRLLVISGARDRVVPAGDSSELLDAAAARGARIVRSPDFNHPFMDKDQRLYRERQELIRMFLLPSSTGRSPGPEADRP